MAGDAKAVAAKRAEIRVFLKQIIMRIPCEKVCVTALRMHREELSENWRFRNVPKRIGSRAAVRPQAFHRAAKRLAVHRTQVRDMSCLDIGELACVRHRKSISGAGGP